MTVLMGGLAWGLLGGAVAACLHFWLLRRALERIQGLAPQQARRRMMRGLPLRMMPWALLAAILAPKGWPAMLGIVAGLGVVRWLACHKALTRKDRDQRLLVAD